MMTNAKIQTIVPNQASPGSPIAYMATDVSIIDNYLVSPASEIDPATFATLYDDLAENIVEHNNQLIGYAAQTGELEIPQKDILKILVRMVTSGDNQKTFIFNDVPIWTDPVNPQNRIVGNLTSTGYEFAERGGAYFTRQFMLDHDLTSESDLNITIAAFTK